MKTLGLLLVSWLALGCTAEVAGGPENNPENQDSQGDPADVGDPDPVETGDDSNAVESTTIPVPGEARVCSTGALNQRSGPSTFSEILKVIPAGSTVKILAASSGWYQNEWNGSTGWSAGQYLCPITAGDTPPGPGGAGLDETVPSRDATISVAYGAIGFSYWWGWAALKTGGNFGSCAGSCGNGCTHSGSYGADCSGFVSKAWLLPEAMPMEAKKHPYTTLSFASSTTLWKHIERKDIQRADAMNMRTSRGGHVMIFEHGADPFGQLWTIEAKGCIPGIVRNLRFVGTDYRTVRRTGY